MAAGDRVMLWDQGTTHVLYRKFNWSGSDLDLVVSYNNMHWDDMKLHLNTGNLATSCSPAKVLFNVPPGLWALKMIIVRAVVILLPSAKESTLGMVACFKIKDRTRVFWPGYSCFYRLLNKDINWLWLLKMPKLQVFITDSSIFFVIHKFVSYVIYGLEL